MPQLDAQEMDEALALVKPGNDSMDQGTIRFNRSGIRLSLNGKATGYIADPASVMLAARGIDNHMVNAGGDIRVSTAPGQRPWQIGIRHPGRPDTLLASLALSRGGIATSGSYEKNFDRSGSRHHLISHVSGRSPDIRSVSVWARSAMEADALATALSLMPPAEALRHVEATTSAACLIIDRHGRRYASPGWS